MAKYSTKVPPGTHNFAEFPLLEPGITVMVEQLHTHKLLDSTHRPYRYFCSLQVVEEELVASADFSDY